MKALTSAGADLSTATARMVVGSFGTLITSLRDCSNTPRMTSNERKAMREGNTMMSEKQHLLELSSYLVFAQVGESEVALPDQLERSPAAIRVDITPLQTQQR